MPKKPDKLTTFRQTEDAAVKLFDRIDRGVHRYIESAQNDSLKIQAMRNAIAMLDILKVIYRNDYKLCPTQTFQGMTDYSKSCAASPERQGLRQ